MSMHANGQLENTAEATQILADESGIKLETAKLVMERTHLNINPVPGDKQVQVLKGVGPILVESGDVPTSQTLIRR